MEDEEILYLEDEDMGSDRVNTPIPKGEAINLKL
jgi:hypothetical protein